MMIDIHNRLFSLYGPWRGDLSGRPFGFLFMWRPKDYPLKWYPKFIYSEKKSDWVPSKTEGTWRVDSPTRFCRMPCKWSFGFFFEVWREASKPGPYTIGCDKYGWWRARRVPVPRFKLSIGVPA